MVKVIIHGRCINLENEEAEGVAKQIFAQQKVQDVANALDRLNKEATAGQIKRIADNLYSEIFEHDEDYWELEDKNILYLAEQMGLKDIWETA